ncbi:MAG: hypothetical protein JO112_11140 [Planctomycetes bacterium]|nr:hypothetical protein [Planctomycetota bacterium]
MAHPSDKGPLNEQEAMEFARASLRIGMNVQEIEQRLVARGLSSGAAAAVVNAVLEEGVGGRFGTLAEDEGRQRFHRVLSVAVGVACVMLGYFFGGAYSAGRTAVGVSLPLASIWFPGVMATARDWPALLRWCGWLVLLLIAAYRVLLLVWRS